MSTAIICIILVIVAAIGIKSYVKRLSSGCCGASAGKPLKKIRVKDRTPGNYPFRKILLIDGMVCGNCAVRVENALNNMEGIWAQVNLERREADVRMKQEVPDDELRASVREAGYTVYRIENKEG